MKASARAKAYNRWKFMLSGVSWAVEVAFLLVLVLTGLSVWMADVARDLGGGFFVHVAIFVLIFLALSEFLSLPLAFARGYLIEKHYGLSRDTVRGWLKDHAKGLGLNALLTLLLVEILYALVLFGGRWWWVWTAAIFSGIFVILARLAPVLIFPLFFKFTPLADGALRERLEQLSQRAGASISGIYAMNLSRKTNAANAALAGIGRSRRIILADTLLQRFPDEEVEVVVAHEIGHHLHGHLLQGVVLQTAATFFFFWLVDAVAGRWAQALGYGGGLRDLAALPILALVAAALGLAGTPLVNGLLRRYERQADRTAIELTRMPEAFVSTMKRLASMNMADPAPHPLVEFLFYSHPSIQRRVEFCERMAKPHA